MADGSDNTILVLGLGGLALYLLKKNADEKAAQAAQLAAQAVPGSVLTGRPLVPQAKPVEQIVAGQVGAAVGNAILPGAGAVVGAIAQEEVKAATDIIHGNVTPVNVAEVAFFPVAVTMTAVHALGDLFGWNGKPLDDVNDILLASFTEGNKDNTGGGTVYALDATGTLHRLQPRYGCVGDTIWCAGYSWREIIAVRPEVLGQFPVGYDVVDRSQIQPVMRSIDPDDLRSIFGFDAIFKLGNVNTLYGPGVGKSTATLLGVRAGAPEGPSAVYQVLHPWEGGDYGLHPIGRSWKRHIASPQALYNHGWSFSNVVWVDQSKAGLIPTFEELQS